MLRKEVSCKAFRVQYSLKPGEMKTGFFSFLIHSRISRVDMGQDISLEFYCNVATYFGICLKADL